MSGSARRTAPSWFRAASWLWTGLILVWSIVVYLSGVLPDHDPFVAWLNFLAPFFALLASVIVTRAPGNSIAWLMGTVATSIGFSAALEFVIPEAPPSEASVLLLVALVYQGISWLFFVFPMLLVPFLFPTGRFLTPRWRWAGWLVGTMVAILSGFSLIVTPIAPSYRAWAIENPWGLLPESVFDEYLMAPWSFGLLILALGGVLSLIVRFRRSNLIERTQIKWVLYAVVMFGLTYALSIAELVNVPADEEASLIVPLFWAWFSLSFALVPVSIVFAISRYKLFEIDRIFSRTITYIGVLGLLGVVYAGALYLLGTVLPFESDLAVAGSTLTVVALFNPIRRRIQDFVDRRFFRSKYDAAEVLRAFVGRLSGPMTGTSLSARLSEVLDTTMRPEVISVWVREES